MLISLEKNSHKCMNLFSEGLILVYNQVGATTEKWPVLRKQDRMGYRATSCPEITARPALTGIYIL